MIERGLEEEDKVKSVVEKERAAVAMLDVVGVGDIGKLIDEVSFVIRVRVLVDEVVVTRSARCRGLGEMTEVSEGDDEVGAM